MRVTWKCPMCGHENTDSTDEQGMNVFICDSEDGGCDKYSVIDVRQVVSINTRIFKIEEVNHA